MEVQNENLTTNFVFLFACNANKFFAVGAALGPADLEDSISSGGAAAMKAVASLRKLMVATQ